MNLENVHLVAIDAGSSDPRLVVARPPVELSKDEALAFAAHLITHANTALSQASRPVPSPLDFARQVRMTCHRPTLSAMKDASGKVHILKPCGSLSADEGLVLAAELVASADPDADVLALVTKVVEGAAAELDRILEHEGHEVTLSAPMRTRLDVPADVAPPPTVEEHTEEQAEERKRMRR